MSKQRAILQYQSQVQSLFTDAAAENARLQFNAKSQTQIDQFYDQLGATVTKANLDRETATKQFNVDQANSMTKYLEKLEDSEKNLMLTCNYRLINPMLYGEEQLTLPILHYKMMKTGLTLLRC